MIMHIQHYTHYIRDSHLLSIYTRTNLKANMLRIEMRIDLKIGLKIEPLLLKIKPHIGLKIGDIGLKIAYVLIGAIQFV